METSQDGKQSKHSYFYINFKMLVNVIKYKLDRIRFQIELDENQFTTRAQFKCTQCAKTYSDLDTKDIFLTMRCIHCGADVDEDTSALPKQSARNLLNKFNTQMAPIFELLSRVEHIRLADCILRPEPVDMSYVLERMYASSSSLSSMTAQNGQNKTGANATGRSAMIKVGLLLYSDTNIYIYNI
jgi:transcription initiation factor TFIIE subunit alpha